MDAETTVRMPSTGTFAQRLRMATGLVLFAFLFTHLCNHALGLVSIEAMQEARAWRIAVTRSLPAPRVLALAFMAHLALGVTTFLSLCSGGRGVSPLQLPGSLCHPGWNQNCGVAG
jgi:succinate dehydrogenase/fumarate reductase cytochrome b subunit